MEEAFDQKENLILNEKESKRKLGGSVLVSCAIQGRFSKANRESLSQPESAVS